MKRIHILGICGTFMGGVALLARECGIEVSGSDASVYPPMSTQLEQAGISLCEGYDPEHIPEDVDCVVVGNVMARGNPSVEFVLNRGIKYMSGPQWLEEYLLMDRWVLAVAGTHGKTSTASMLAWILEYAGLSPGFLIGGVPANFQQSARSGEHPFFVVEADEYDTAFFDKRSKFVHYRPRTLVLNNLEFDHADIFPDLAAIQTQFHHLVRIVPGEGLIVANGSDDALGEVLARGCWTPVETVSLENSSGWSATPGSENNQIRIFLEDKFIGHVDWEQMGAHSAHNALSAIAAARHAGVAVEVSIEALGKYRGVKRRMELRGEVDGIRVYDDFAHHPTAIQTTLEGIKSRYPDRRVLAVLEPRSNTMRMGVHRNTLSGSVATADLAWMLRPAEIDWDLESAMENSDVVICESIDRIIREVVEQTRTGDLIVVMSNGGFGGIHDRLLDALQKRTARELA